MTQTEAKRHLEHLLSRRLHSTYDTCTGNAETCPIDECMVCGVRDCPDHEPLHYHHDGCPVCFSKERLM